MNHHTSPEFWPRYEALPLAVQKLADRAFALLRRDPRHPSLQLKKVQQYWSVRVGLHHRAVGVDASDGVLWFWIGTHAEYDQFFN